jgi:16S rRNA (guanine527-N7)-methyltransferase
MVKKTDFLREVLTWPDAPTGAQVVTERAESAARRPDMEGTFDLVTARSFARPAVTAECAARFLELGGHLIVSEPPEDPGVARWDPEGLARLGLRALGRRRHGPAFQVLVKESATPPEYPRPVGVPRKRPLF